MSGQSGSEQLRHSTEHSKTSTALGAEAHTCARTAQGLPAENKVADTSWASSQPPPITLKKPCRRFLVQEGPLQSSCGGTLGLSWRRREERHYPEATAQWPSLSSITERGSEKRTGQNVTILKGTFLFKTLYSVILHMQILCPSLDFGEFRLCLIPGVLKNWVKCGENLCCKMITVLVCLV